MNSMIVIHPAHGHSTTSPPTLTQLAAQAVERHFPETEAASTAQGILAEEAAVQSVLVTIDYQSRGVVYFNYDRYERSRCTQMRDYCRRLLSPMSFFRGIRNTVQALATPEGLDTACRFLVFGFLTVMGMGLHPIPGSPRNNTIAAILNNGTNTTARPDWDSFEGNYYSYPPEP